MDRPGHRQTPARSTASAGVSRTLARSRSARRSSRSSGVSRGMSPVYIMTMPDANQTTNSRLSGIPR